MNHPNDECPVSLPSELFDLARQLDVQLVGAEPIATLQTAFSNRATYRLEGHDGRTFKGRLLRKPGQAERLQFALAQMQRRHFSQVLASSDQAQIEEWIPGTCLADLTLEPEEYVRAGILLAQIHITPVPPHDGLATHTEHRQQVADKLTQLLQLGALTVSEQEALSKQVARHCPETVDMGFLHRDFCAHNLVLRDETLVSIDNVKMTIGPLDEDLARTWYHWPMQEEHWNAFLAGYGRYRSADRFLRYAPYWVILALASSAVFRLRAKAPKAHVPLDQLRNIVRNGFSLSPPPVPACLDSPPVSAGVQASAASASQADAPVNRCLEYAGCHIAVSVSQTGTWDWLQEFLCPAFDAGECADPDWHVTLEFGTSRFTQQAQRGDTNELPMIDSFTLDGEFKRHEVWDQTPESIVLRLKGGDVFCEVARHQRKVTLYANSVTCRVRPVLMRILREIATRQAIHARHIPIHASVVAFEGQAVMLSGLRRAGKTSLMLHALADSHADLVGNDRGFLHVTRAGITVRGMPTILKIRADAMKRFPAVAERYHRQPYTYAETMQESRARFHAVRSVADDESRLDSIRLTTAQLCEFMGARAMQQAPLAAIVFPYIDADVPALRIRPIGPEAAATKLFQEGLLRPSSPLRVPELFAEGSVQDVFEDKRLQDICRQVTSRTPCYTCGLGPQAYERPFLISALEEANAVSNKDRFGA